MKKILIIIIAFNFWIINAFSQALMNEDFESYDQGPIANQNPGWSDFTMATADVKWDGGDFTACTEQDNNRAYLSYTSGDNVESRVVVSSATQMQLDLHVVNETGFHIRFNQDNENIFEYINSINIQEISYKFIIDFYNLKAEVYINDTLVQTSSIENNYNNLTSIDFSNSFGKFKLGCIYLTDITDIDNDGYTIYSDCDDNNPDVHPGATEIVYNGIDDDCNPATLDNDLDQDGFNSPEDCDDNNPDVHPGATEIAYNGVDDDCNPATLENDLDQDGFKSPEDCDDNNPDVNPGAQEIPNNGIDDNCDGSVDETAHIKSIKHGIKILPNPCINILSIEAEEPIENVSVFDFQGKEMLIEYRSKTIPVNQLPSGIYVIRIKYTNGENSVATFLKI